MLRKRSQFESIWSHPVKSDTVNMSHATCNLFMQGGFWHHQLSAEYFCVEQACWCPSNQPQPLTSSFMCHSSSYTVNNKALVVRWKATWWDQTAGKHRAYFQFQRLFSFQFSRTSLTLMFEEEKIAAMVTSINRMLKRDYFMVNRYWNGPFLVIRSLLSWENNYKYNWFFRTILFFWLEWYLTQVS